MNKKVLVSALVAAFAAPAMAQNVSVSGNIDAGYLGASYKNKTGDAIKTSLFGNESAQSTSEIRFAATEDLGGGMKASAYVSSQIGSRTDTTAEVASDVQSALSARDAWVALSGGFGEIKIGRFTPAAETIGNSYVHATANYLGHGLDTNIGTGGVYQNTTAGEMAAYSLFTPYSTQVTSAQIELGRQGGNIQFTTPEVQGLQAVIGTSKIANNVTATSANDNSGQEKTVTNLGATYKMGNLRASIASADATVDASTSNTAKSTADVTVYGLGYKFAAADVALAFASGKTNNGTTDIYKASVWNISAAAPMASNVVLKASYGFGTLEDMTAARTYDSTAIQLGADYILSKRTSLYAMFGSNEMANKTADVENQISGFAAGIRHQF